MFESVIRGAIRKYGAMFDEKLFLEQLDYMGDISDFSIEYIAEPISEEKIHETLHQIIRTYLKEKRQRRKYYNERLFDFKRSP